MAVLHRSGVEHVVVSADGQLGLEWLHALELGALFVGAVSVRAGVGLERGVGAFLDAVAVGRENLLERRTTDLVWVFSVAALVAALLLAAGPILTRGLVEHSVVDWAFLEAKVPLVSDPHEIEETLSMEGHFHAAVEAAVHCVGAVGLHASQKVFGSVVDDAVVAEILDSVFSGIKVGFGVADHLHRGVLHEEVLHALLHAAIVGLAVSRALVDHQFGVLALLGAELLHLPGLNEVGRADVERRVRAQAVVVAALFFVAELVVALFILQLGFEQVLAILLLVKEPQVVGKTARTPHGSLEAVVDETLFFGAGLAFAEQVE